MGRLLVSELGLRTLPTFDRRVFGGLRISRIALVEGDAHNTLDLVEPRDPAYATRALSRAIESSLRERPIRVLGAEDFVLLKLLSTRERDLTDAESVLRSLRDELERDLIEREVERLAAGIPDYDVRTRWRRLIEGETREQGPR
ncbi:MAG: hypothetical protein IT371_31710 [Deltaproteobacteria bacterium]|nr:hypothetical protein [Deltaproteobacteria bacterium]